MAIGKSLRFEVFARDSFTCQYCGQRPPDVVLEADHIHPVSKGGTDEIINLITSCFDCNRGKRDKVISDVAPRPDADLAFLKVQQEIVEVKRFLSAKKRLDAARKKVCVVIQQSWVQKLTPQEHPTERVILTWLKMYGPDEIEASIQAASPSYQSGKFGRYDECEKLLRYVGAILRNRSQEPERWVG